MRLNQGLQNIIMRRKNDGWDSFDPKIPTRHRIGATRLNLMLYINKNLPLMNCLDILFDEVEIQ